MLHRNKRAMTLNLKSPEGLALFRRMVAKADVVVENYRPDVKDRLGIDYASLAAINPRIVLGSISGFGQDGPYAKRPGFDQIAQGMGGLMSVTGLPGQGPVRAGIPVADLTAGLYCALGIMVALLEREATGKGRWVHVSLLEAMVAMMDFQATRWTMDGRGAAAGRQRPPDHRADRPVPHQRRRGEHRRRRRRDVAPHRRDAGHRGAGEGPGHRDGGSALPATGRR